jgi:pre-mRNA cleavage complex 2 protein Pcf11
MVPSRRPHLIESLYQAKPDQCRQCGRRFPNTEEGKKAKVKHLDWHFRVNSRVADNTRNAIVHRSPYLNELVSPPKFDKLYFY